MRSFVEHHQLGSPPAGWHETASAVFVFAGSLTVYLLTLSPTINSFDSAELIAGAYSLGIVHATGYPLYLLLAHAAAAVPVGSVALNINLLSALTASVAVLFIYLTARHLTDDPVLSIFTSLLFAFSRSVWAQAVIAEVYPLTAMLLSALVYVTLRWQESGRAWQLWLAMFLLGLNLTNHLGSVLYAPGLALLLITSRERHRLSAPSLLAAGLFFALPLSLYLYLPIRFAADPALNYVGDYFDVNLASPGGVAWMISGRMFAREMFGASPGDALRNMLSLLYQLWLDLLGLGAIGAAVGLPNLTAKHRGFASFLVISMVGTIVFLGSYDVVDRRTMLLPALIALMPLVAVGLSRIGKALQAADRLPLSAGRRTAGAIVALGLVIGFDVYLNWESVDRSADYSAYVFADAVMEQVADDAFIVAQWTSATPLEYMQIVEGRRPDVEVFDRGLFILGIRERFVRSGQQDQLPVEDAIQDALIGHIRGQLQQRPVYLIEDDPFLRAHFCLVRQRNDIYRLVEECESSSISG